MPKPNSTLPDKSLEVTNQTSGPDEEQLLRIGMREGYGRFIAKDRSNVRSYEYVGHWTDNKRDGPGGRCYYYNGDLYEGEWLRGKRHGKGTAFL